MGQNIQLIKVGGIGGNRDLKHLGLYTSLGAKHEISRHTYIDFERTFSA